MNFNNSSVWEINLYEFYLLKVWFQIILGNFHRSRCNSNSVLVNFSHYLIHSKCNLNQFYKFWGKFFSFSLFLFVHLSIWVILFDLGCCRLVVYQLVFAPFSWSRFKHLVQAQFRFGPITFDQMPVRTALILDQT